MSDVALRSPNANKKKFVHGRVSAFDPQTSCGTVRTYSGYDAAFDREVLTRIGLSTIPVEAKVKVTVRTNRTPWRVVRIWKIDGKSTCPVE